MFNHQLNGLAKFSADTPLLISSCILVLTSSRFCSFLQAFPHSLSHSFVLSLSLSFSCTRSRSSVLDVKTS